MEGAVLEGEEANRKIFRGKNLLVNKKKIRKMFDNKKPVRLYGVNSDE